MTVIYPSVLECVLFGLLGVIFGLFTKMLILAIIDGARSLLGYLQSRKRQKRDIDCKGTAWDETIRAFERSDNPLP